MKNAKEGSGAGAGALKRWGEECVTKTRDSAMSLSALVSSSRTNTNTADRYDHEIYLLDTTDGASQASELPSEAIPPSDTPRRRESGVALGKSLVKGNLREELARRKYAKWQEDRDNGSEDAIDSSDNENGQSGEGSVENGSKSRGPPRKKLRDKLQIRHKTVTKAKTQEDYEVDILYENQRGSFLCGIPLYSSKSLLNFDPSAWQTSAFKDSPVNITNAQVPDPSWTWAWRSWYVDMSHDVDEEGWEYSFSFQPGFSWHGSHPWFHSFVRRRRWLRKRVKVQNARQRGLKGIGNEGHMLNLDYFTIHAAKRERSRESSRDRSVNNGPGYLSSNPQPSDSDEEETEINDISALMRALRKATVDRKKIEIVKNFLQHGGDDVHYLPEYMVEIMSMFLYQTSRLQFAGVLQSIYESDAKRSMNEAEGTETSTDREPESKNVEILRKSVDAANRYVKDLECWVDSNKTKEIREHQTDRQGRKVSFQDSSLELGDTSQGSTAVHEIEEEDLGEHEIKGIPREADMDKAPGLNVYRPEDIQKATEEAASSSRKGKEKA